MVIVLLDLRAAQWKHHRNSLILLQKENLMVLCSMMRNQICLSITVMAEDVIPNNPIGRVCETLCPLRTQDGFCRWPDAGCAQLSSQFVGLKANFDAFDKLSIYDSCF